VYPGGVGFPLGKEERGTPYNTRLGQELKLAECGAR